MEVLPGYVCLWVLLVLGPIVGPRIRDWNRVRKFPWWRYRIYWETTFGYDDRPIEVSRDWALERIRLFKWSPAFTLSGIGSDDRVYAGGGRKALRFTKRDVADDSEFSYYRVRRPLTRWRAVTGQTALDTIGKHGVDVDIGMERLHNGEILRAGRYRVLATPISEQMRP